MRAFDAAAASEDVVGDGDAGDAGDAAAAAFFGLLLLIAFFRCSVMSALPRRALVTKEIFWHAPDELNFDFNTI